MEAASSSLADEDLDPDGSMRGLNLRAVAEAFSIARDEKAECEEADPLRTITFEFSVKQPPPVLLIFICENMLLPRVV